MCFLAYKYRITARYSTSDNSPCVSLPTSTELQHGTQLQMKSMPLSLAMFDIQYLIKECLDTCAILYPCIKHILKQSMKIMTVSVHWKWDRLVIYWHTLVKCRKHSWAISIELINNIRICDNDCQLVTWHHFIYILFVKQKLLWTNIIMNKNNQFYSNMANFKVICFKVNLIFMAHQSTWYNPVAINLCYM